ncbi:ABC-type lipoprotein release transport system permease subunit [Tumebacillus sp. BK434]|uniref:ABC transporter permease n=1 Tax=Tumebacillus sp. BK434 TaxID=2512169 RepID=UPI0010460317|nr:ABC transporter permease [Tumebacillus sp. BK434]TCP58263.1 ABC-type lipoprotein release transport system permease subunit [Tumebacillus sp. BK434]
MIVTLLLGLPLLWMLWQLYRTARRAPHLRRMAWRNLVLHKSTAALTVLGAMIGTALITSALLFQHSMVQSGEHALERQFGRIGYDAQAGSGVVPERVVADLREQVEQGQLSDVTGVLPTAALVSELHTTDATGATLLMRPGVYLHGFDHEQARQFDQAAMAGVPEIGVDEIVLSEPVAEQLEVTAGSRVASGSAVFLVKAVVPEQGLTGYRGSGHAAGTALVSLDTARKLAGVPEGAYTNVLLSYPTYLFGSGRLDSTIPVLSGTGLGLQDRAVRGEAEWRLDKSRKLLPIFTIASWTAILIGVMLILNIFHMIAEERRQELGVLRALGMTRVDLGALLRLEGEFYALLSGGVGLLAGLGLAYEIMLSMGGLFASAVAQEEGLQVDYQLLVGAEPLLQGFSIGVLLILLCSRRVSKRASDLTIVEALYAAGDTRRERIGKGKLSLSRTAVRLVTAVLTAVLFLLTLTDAFRTGLRETFSGTFPLWLFAIGFALTLSCAMLVTAAFGPLSGVIDKTLAPFGRLVAVLRMALRYPMLEKTRTTLLVLMFALVFFLTSLSGVFSETMAAQFGERDVRLLTGGYDLVATAEGKRITTEQLKQQLQDSPHVETSSVAAVAAVWQTALFGEDDPGFERTEYPNLNGIDAAFAGQTTLQLRERDPAYASDREAWLAVANDPGVMIVSEQDMQWAELPKKRIIGVAAYEVESISFLASSGVFVKQSEVERLATDPQRIATELLIRLQNEQAAAQTVKGIEKALTQQGIYPMRNVQAELHLNSSFVRMLFTTFEGFCLLAALIGIGGLAIIMMRVIRERRQGIGMLRAIGVRPGLIYWSIMVEGALIGMLGILIGSLCGSYVGAVMIELFAEDEPITLLFPYAKIGLYVGGTLLIALLGTMLPAWQAFKLPPAEATKYLG